MKVIILDWILGQ